MSTKTGSVGVGKDGQHTVLQDYTGGGAHTTSPDGTTVNGGLKVSGVDEPARDSSVLWIFGTETSFDTLTVNSNNEGNIFEIGDAHPDARQLLITCEELDGGAAIDYDYDVFLSMNGNTAVKVATSLTADAETTHDKLVNIPASAGQFTYLHVTLRPEVGQTLDRLNFKACLMKRSG